MKKFIVLAIILAAGLSVYPQATRTVRKSETEKTAVKRETSREASKAQQQTQQAEAQSTRTLNNEATDADRSGNARRRVITSDRNTVRTDPQRSSVRTTRAADPAEVRVTSSSATRVYREDKGVLTRDDGTVFRHQNDQVFTNNRYNVNYYDYSALRRSDDFRTEYYNYYNWYDNRSVRYVTYGRWYQPMSLDYRRDRYIYRQPVHYDLIWTPYLFNRFMYYYPGYTDWDIDYGRGIETISSYDVSFYVGTVRRVYGKVEEVYYSREDQNYILYLGDRFPYHDLSVVIPRQVARQITGTPQWYFDNEYIWLVGLIELWENKPEIIIRDEEQIRRY